MSKGEVILNKVSAGWEILGDQIIFADLSGIKHPKAVYDSESQTISMKNDGVTLMLRKTEKVGI